MPKLSKKTLDKMFICPTCGKPFRTRQGLSGHIQFKHGEQEKTPNKKLIDEVVNIRKAAKILEISGLPDTETKSIISIIERWLKIEAMCNIFKITPNNQDYKNYIISSLAKVL